tara:strand:+ start:116 stop:499 length:384 start_codon:yes stop_codon:yes gene_type:complete
MSSSTLSRGRTQITRSRANVGNVVHEAAENVEYVHLFVLKGVPLVDTTDDAVVVNQNDGRRNVQLRVFIGEADYALCFNVDADMSEQVHLATNLCVSPYEKICINSSDPKANLVISGIVTQKPILHF